ncbi:MAG: FecR domain-containing protein, partial [Lentisphaeria bacterium]|nr:FecR domain-containing protein [Lentisphaeria bacterium]
MRLLTLLSFALVLTASAEVARQRAGIVTALRGEVSVQAPGGEGRPPAIKEQIFEGDTIKTGNRGRVQICFEDDSIVSIGRDATLVVTKFFFDPSARQGAMQIEVKEGFFRVLGGAVTRIAPENFETVAGTASIGIRGCSLGGEVGGGRATLVFFGSNIGGGIEVGGAGVQRFLGTPGDGVTVPRNGPPSMPSPMERFGVRILNETRVDGEGGGEAPPDGKLPPGQPESLFDPTLLLDERVPGPLPDGNILMHGFAIGEELQTGWLYRNGSPELLSLELTTLNGLLAEVVSGKMTVSVHTNANFAF